jgi:hypothetical protein
LSKQVSLEPKYQSYDTQKCFVGYSQPSAWIEDLRGACNEVLPEFNLEPYYADDHFKTTLSVRDKVVEMIANAKYGIYDLSGWQDNDGYWHLPHNVLIEIGIAISQNRPVLLIRHHSSKCPLPKSLETVEIFEFAGPVTVKAELQKRLPEWIKRDQELAWYSSLCNFTHQQCEFREIFPSQDYVKNRQLNCIISDGLGTPQFDHNVAERQEYQEIFEEILGDYNVRYQYLHELSLVEGYKFLLCAHCQSSRTSHLAIHRIGANTAADVFLLIGMTIGLSTRTRHPINQIIWIESRQAIPSLLAGYEYLEAKNLSEARRKLKKLIPEVIRGSRPVSWNPQPIPFEIPLIYHEVLIDQPNLTQIIHASLLAFKAQMIEEHLSRADVERENNFIRRLGDFINGFIVSSKTSASTVQVGIRSDFYPMSVEVRRGEMLISVTALFVWRHEQNSLIDRVRTSQSSSIFLLIADKRLDNRFPQLDNSVVVQVNPSQVYSGQEEEEEEEEEDYDDGEEGRAPKDEED